MHAFALTLSTDSICFGGVDHDCDCYGLDQQPPAPSACLDFLGWRATRLVCLLVPTWQPVLHYQEGYGLRFGVLLNLHSLSLFTRSYCTLALCAPSHLEHLLSCLYRSSCAPGSTLVRLRLHLFRRQHIFCDLTITRGNQKGNPSRSASHSAIFESTACILVFRPCIGALHSCD